jgi:hypothetical protein
MTHGLTARPLWKRILAVNLAASRQLQAGFGERKRSSRADLYQLRTGSLRD